MYCHFKDTSLHPHRFFDLLPPDWQEGIVPFWPVYSQTSRIFTLETETTILGGGIVFASPAPDAVSYQEEAQSWFDQHYLYIGFLWFDEKFRGKNLGSRWLRELEKEYPGQNFWLAVEDEGLAAFYQKNGFRTVKTVEADGGTEWIMINGD